MPDPHKYIKCCTGGQNAVNTCQSIEHLVWLSVHEAATKKASNFDVKSSFLNAGLFLNLYIYNVLMVTSC